MERIRLVMAAGLVVAAACGSSTSPGGGMQPPPNGQSASVSIQDFSFAPGTITIKAGTTVTWTNNGPTTHTTTSDAGTWNSGNLSPPSGGGGYGGGSPGATYSVTFATAGTYTYHCALHPPSISTYANFTGTITVTP